MELKEILAIMAVVLIVVIVAFASTKETQQLLVVETAKDIVVMGNTVIQMHEGRIHLYPKDGFDQLDPITYGRPVTNK